MVGLFVLDLFIRSGVDIEPAGRSRVFRGFLKDVG